MPRTKGKPPLSQDKILRTAVKYADKNGIDSLNMRQLARELDAGAMSLYHYFPSKDLLLNAMVDWVAAKISAPSPETDWQTGITEIATSLYELMMKHPWIIGIWNQRTVGPNKLAYMESILRTLREGGFSVALACDAYHAVTAHIEGFSLQAAAFPVKAKDLRSAAEAFLRQLEEPQAIPYFVEHVEHHLEHIESSDGFSMMLAMILDGFAAKVSESSDKNIT